MPWKHALRDLVLVLVTLALWRVDAVLRDQAGVLPVLIAVAAGSMTAVSGYLAHEWGHLAGAWAGGSAMRLPESPASLFLFNYDSDRNRREQFLLMSCGGFASSIIIVALLVAILPPSSLAAQVALGLTAAGVLATAILEVPPFARVWRGGPIPRGAAYVSTPANVAGRDPQ